MKPKNSDVKSWELPLQRRGPSFEVPREKNYSKPLIIPLTLGLFPVGGGGPAALGGGIMIQEGKEGTNAWRVFVQGRDARLW